MKRFLCILLVAAMLLALNACRFTTNFSDNTGMTSAQCIPQVETMLEALVAGDLDAAAAQMYPAMAERSGDAIKQMCDYLAGRTVAELNHKGVSVNTSKSTDGEIRQENVALQAVLADGTVFYISAAYRTDNDAAGFVSFQIVLGVV